MECTAATAAATSHAHGTSDAATAALLASLGGGEDKAVHLDSGFHLASLEPISRTPAGSFYSPGNGSALTLPGLGGASNGPVPVYCSRGDSSVTAAICRSALRLLETALPGLVEAGKVVASLRLQGVGGEPLDGLPEAIRRVQEACRIMNEGLTWTDRAQLSDDILMPERASG